MIELQVIKTLLNKNTWVAYRKFVNKEQLTKELLTLLEILDTYTSSYTRKYRFLPCKTRVS